MSGSKQHPDAKEIIAQHRRLLERERVKARQSQKTGEADRRPGSGRGGTR